MAAAAVDGPFDTRLTSAIQYASPVFNGFSAVADYEFVGNKTTNSTAATKNVDGKIWEAGLNYDNGPWSVKYGYGKFESGTDAIANTALTEWKSNRLGAGYTFDGGHKVNLIWDKQEQDFAGGANLSHTGWSLQGLYKVNAPGSLIAEYTKVSDASGSYLASNSDTGAKMYTVGYLYSLSKRTTLKALYTKIKNDNNAAYDFSGSSTSDVGGTAGGATALGAGASPTALAVGIRHSF